MPTQHTVVQGDCLENIAFKYGFFPETVWNHSDNADLRERCDPASLLPGDVIVIPDMRRKTFSVSTGRRHRFVRRGVPSWFRVTLDIEDTSLVGLEYTLNIDDGRVQHRGTLAAGGRVEHPMPPDCRHAVFTVGDEVFEFDLGHLDPVETRQGVVERLHALGYLEEGGEISDERLAAAIRHFQIDNGLKPTGESNDATRDALTRQQS